MKLKAFLVSLCAIAAALVLLVGPVSAFWSGQAGVRSYEPGTSIPQAAYGITQVIAEESDGQTDYSWTASQIGYNFTAGTLNTVLNLPQGQTISKVKVSAYIFDPILKQLQASGQTFNALWSRCALAIEIVKGKAFPAFPAPSGQVIERAYWGPTAPSVPGGWQSLVQGTSFYPDYHWESLWTWNLSHPLTSDDGGFTIVVTLFVYGTSAPEGWNN